MGLLDHKIATPYFHKRLRAIAKDNGIAFIVDEAQSGIGSTGKMWAHENWHLTESPDIVVFGGKAGITGFYSTLDYRLGGEDQICEQVDFSKMINYQKVWKTILKKNLLAYVNDTSTFLKIELNRVQKETNLIADVRGEGTMIGFDVDSLDTARKVQRYLLKSGILVMQSGETTFSLKPSLILGPTHAAHLREGLLYYSPNFDRHL